MSCDITKGLSEIACKNGVGGLKAVYIIPYGEYDFTATSDDVDGHIISDLGTTEGTPVNEAFKYPLKNTGNTYSEPVESSRDAGTTVFQPTLNFVINKINPQMQFQMKMLAWGRPLIVVESNGGDFFLIGKDNGMEVTPTSNIEGEMTGANNYSFEAVGEEREPAYFLDEAAITELKSVVSEDNI